MNCHIHSHNNAELNFPNRLRGEILEAVLAIDVEIKHCAATALRSCVLNRLFQLGWSDKVMLEVGSNISVTSIKQDVGLCLQTGNVARIYADMLKLQALYLDGEINFGALVLPSYEISRVLGSNIANFDRLSRELDIFKKVFSVPSLIFSIEP